mmetsp:Transcript_16512/g.34750  ORF Transcript_16512/g.34750 Transcript_16512/m.34750 type:complete len:181 (-) Transcript_16512:135-677(-)
MAIHTMKRARPTKSTFSSASASDQDEYEHAVAFLREFHSRRVANTLHSTSLDAILEAEHFDEMLASEFSIALSVGCRASSSSENLNKSGDRDRNNKPIIKKNGTYRNSHRRRRNHPSSLKRMKKTTTSKCLMDLDASSSSSSNDKLVPSVSSLFVGCGVKPVCLSQDVPLGTNGFYFDCD